MRQNERWPEMLEHSLAVVLLAKLQGREPHQRPYVTSEALRRRGVEVVGDISHREAGVIEQSRRAHAAKHPGSSNPRAARMSRASARYCLGAGTRARKNRLMSVLGRTSSCCASARTVATCGGQVKSISKKGAKTRDALARSSASWPSALRCMSSPPTPSK